MTRSRRVDANHAEIRSGLRQCGFCVWDTHTLGDGFPDLLVRVGDAVVLLEVKMPGAGLTPHEEAFGALFPVEVVHDLAEAIMVCQEGRRYLSILCD